MSRFRRWKWSCSCIQVPAEGYSFRSDDSYFTWRSIECRSQEYPTACTTLRSVREQLPDAAKGSKSARIFLQTIRPPHSPTSQLCNKPSHSRRLLRNWHPILLEMGSPAAQTLFPNAFPSHRLIGAPFRSLHNKSSHLDASQPSLSARQ
jgi:hypothetical protein